MKRNTLKRNRRSRLILTGAALVLTVTLACQSTTAAAQTGEAATPDLSIGAAQFPNEDAIILRWEQHWTLDEDGTVHRRDHKWLKLLNRRQIRRVADPRIDFVSGQDDLIIHTARTHLPNGTVLPVPDYSFNIAAPDDVAGWPEYAGWQQQIVSFSGIENDCVIELDYEIITPPGILPWIEADLRLNEDYPTVERIVSVTLPEGTPCRHELDHVPLAQATRSESTVNGITIRHWSFDNLTGAPAEPQSLPWQQRCGRLRFTTCPSVATWISVMSDRVNRMGHPDDAIKAFAEAAVEGEPDPAERVRKVVKKLHDSFNRITSPKSLRSLTCRDAHVVFRANYGNPLESAALCLAALRGLALDGLAKVAVDATAWSEQVPTLSSFAGVVLEVTLPEGPMYVRPELTVLPNLQSWGRHWLLNADSSGLLLKTYVYARGEKEPSELDITGKITIDAEGKATGELRIRATGLSFDPAKLETADAQGKLVKRFVGGVLSDFNVPEHSVVTLSDETFRATASVVSDGALKSLGDLHVLRFGKGPVFLADVPMPLARSYRTTDVQLAGRFKERVDVTVELPDGWQPSIIPGSLALLEGTWGTVSQTVDASGKTIRLGRDVAVRTETLVPADFDTLRRAVNDLRAHKSLLLAFEQTFKPG